MKVELREFCRHFPMFVREMELLVKQIIFFLGEANTGVFKAYTKNHISMHLHGYGKVTPSDFSASFQGRRLKFGTLLHIME